MMQQSRDYIPRVRKHISLDKATMQRFLDFKERNYGLGFQIDSGLFIQAMHTMIDLDEGKCPHACIRFPAHFSKDNCPLMLSCPNKEREQAPE